MTRNLLAIFIGVMIAVAGPVNAAGGKGVKNVAQGKTVAGEGEFFTGGWGSGLFVDFGTLVDEVFFPTWHQWDQGPIWWDETDGVQRKLHVFLGGTYAVNKLTIQVDTNDDYLVSWEDKRGGASEVKVIPQRHWGMAPPVELVIDAVTDRFTIKHDATGAGDGLYSVSEFEAFGTKVEE